MRGGVRSVVDVSDPDDEREDERRPQQRQPREHDARVILATRHCTGYRMLAPHSLFIRRRELSEVVYIEERSISRSHRIQDALARLEPIRITSQRGDPEGIMIPPYESSRDSAVNECSGARSAPRQVHRPYFLQSAAATVHDL